MAMPTHLQAQSNLPRGPIVSTVMATDKVRNSEPIRLLTRFCRKDQSVCVYLYNLNPRPAKTTSLVSTTMCLDSHRSVLMGLHGMGHICTWGRVLLGTLDSRRNGPPLLPLPGESPPSAGGLLPSGLSQLMCNDWHLGKVPHSFRDLMY